MTKDVLHVYLYLMLPLFVVGGVAMFWIVRRRAGESQMLWTKFIVYWLIISLVLFAIGRNSFWILKWILLIGGTLEITYVATRKKPFSVWPLLLALAIYFLILYVIRKYWTISFTDHLYLFTIVVIFDGFSQICGQLFGRHKMVQRVSPGKTWEGFWGGIAITASIVAIYMRDARAVFVVLLLCVGAFGGDLLASYFKRKCGVKDYGNWIPGHGGLLDRFDGLLGAIVAYYVGFYLMYGSIE